MRKALLSITCAALLSSCVAPNSGGITSNNINAGLGSIAERREALRNVQIVETQPANSQSLGTISARRCHRYFTEDQPTLEAMLPDLQIAAYSLGADAIRFLESKKLNGLADNCWYVLEAYAEMYRLPE